MNKNIIIDTSLFVSGFFLISLSLYWGIHFWQVGDVQAVIIFFGCFFPAGILMCAPAVVATIDYYLSKWRN